jgi:hypothetical protein
VGEHVALVHQREHLLLAVAAPATSVRFYGQPR